MPAKKRKSYSCESVQLAVDAINNGMSLREASRTYHIPVATLSLKKRGKVPMEARPGPPTFLNFEEEEQLVKWILFLSGRGFPVTRTQLLDSVQLLLLKTERTELFPNSRPGKHWYKGFIRRHPNLTIRTAQNLSNTRASVTERQIRNWFDEVKAHLESFELMDIEPTRIFNCDESAFQLCPKPEQVIVQRGSRSVYKLVNTDEKECLTTLFMVNAAGATVPPLVMYAYQRLPHSIVQNFPKDWQIGISDKGWMTAETFFEYISNCFYPWLIKQSIRFPVILYVDGHSSHLTLPLVQFCRSVQIELIALFPNSTHILQPLDVAIFHPLKNAWKKVVNEWRIENCGDKLKKEHFAPLLNKALASIHLEESIRNGFRVCGLQPFSPDAVSYNVLNRGNKTPEVEAEPQPNEKDVAIEKHLRFFEKNLEEGTLQKFEAANGSIQNIELTDRGLFEYWMKLKIQSGEEIVRVEDSPEVSMQENCVENILSERNELENILSEPNDANVIIEFISSDRTSEDIAASTILQVLDFSNINSSNNIIENESVNENNSNDINSTNYINDSEMKENNSNIISENNNTNENNNNDQSCSDKEQLDKMEVAILKDVPEIFKETLFWPKQAESNKGKRKRKEKIPTVATSNKWLAYQEQKEKVKKEKDQAIEEKRRKREEMKNIKKEEAENKKRIKAQLKSKKSIKNKP